MSGMTTIRQVKVFSGKKYEQVQQEINDFLRRYQDNQIYDIIGFTQLREMVILVVYQDQDIT